MRERPKDKSRLMHIKTAIDNIKEFLEGKTAEDFLLDKLLYFGVVKNLEIIGEASYMLSNEFRDSHTLTSWKDMIRMRHILVHGYYQIDSRIVWSTIVKDLPILREQIEEYLKETDVN
ncbi:MAG: DUF86 domain-containing protein [Muribaculaceae bacterium]|nr:DUF86 domain-containing protein [Muribaculaceae bacterium]